MSDQDAIVSSSPLLHQALKLMDPDRLLLQLEYGEQTRFGALLMMLGLHGFGKVRVVSTKRTMLEQCVIYGRGRNAEECVRGGCQAKYADPASSRVSWTRPAQSMHPKGLAIDLDVSSYSQLDLAPVAAIAHGLGLTWGGQWTKKDLGHFQVRESN